MIPDALPQLAVGGHSRGSGKACIMNALSYLNGDTVITDMPDCADPLLARLTIYANDHICQHRTNHLAGITVRLPILCPLCTGLMWRAGLRLIGTGDPWKKASYELLCESARVARQRDVLYLHLGIEAIFDTLGSLKPPMSPWARPLPRDLREKLHRITDQLIIDGRLSDRRLKEQLAYLSGALLCLQSSDNPLTVQIATQDVVSAIIYASSRETAGDYRLADRYVADVVATAHIGLSPLPYAFAPTTEDQHAHATAAWLNRVIDGYLSSIRFHPDYGLASPQARPVTAENLAAVAVEAKTGVVTCPA